MLADAASPAAEPSSGRAPKRLRLLQALCVLAALVLVFFLCLVPRTVTDFWWQLKTGELIVRSGTIPTRDPFSWTAAGQPWVVHEWLTEVLFYVLHTHFPRWVLLGYKCALASLACGLVLGHAWRRSGSLPLAIGTAVAAAWVVRNYADLRPQMLSFVFVAGLLWSLEEHSAGRLRRLPWLLPPLFCLWANLHGGVVVGIIILTLWVLGDAVGRWFWREGSFTRKPLALSVLFSAAAVGVNPNGFQVYLYPFQVLGHPEVMDYITEWWSPNFHHADLRPFELLLLATLGALAVSRSEHSGGRSARLRDTLVLLALAHAALVAQRNTATFALVAAPPLAGALGSLWREAAPLERLRAWAEPERVRSAGLAVLAVVLGVGIWRSLPGFAPHRWYDYAIAHDYFPRAAADRMARGEWPGRLYNDYVWGGYLIWRLGPVRPVFIDGRAEVYYPTRAFDDEMLIHRVNTGWQGALHRRGVQVILTDRHGSLARALRRTSAWHEAFTGPVESVFVRK